MMQGRWEQTEDFQLIILGEGARRERRRRGGGGEEWRKLEGTGGAERCAELIGSELTVSQAVV